MSGRWRSLGHHWDVLREAIRADRERSFSFLPSSETEFLPAALEVSERPVSPTARVFSWLLLVGLVIAIAWTVFGRVDVVASAPGTLIPTGNVKLVQSPSPGVVRAIHVRNGDVVEEGQALIDLDPTLTGAELAQAENALVAAQLEIARNRALADALSGQTWRFVPPEGTPSDITATQRRLITAQIAEAEAGAASLMQARQSALADVAATRANLARISDTLPILDRQIASMRQLDERGYAPGQRLLEMERQRRSEAGEREVALAQIERGTADASRLAQQARENREAAMRQALGALADAEAEERLRAEEVTKARQTSSFKQLTSPVAGTIQQLEVHTIGGVVEAARPLMVVVPARGGIEVQARILNRDVGFVHVGQSVAVKLEAFPFTRYGTVPGTVRSISRDAVQDEELGAVYVATIELERASIEADGQRYQLSPGLAVTADIRTGSRSIFSYLLSPLQSTVSQAGRER